MVRMVGDASGSGEAAGTGGRQRLRGEDRRAALVHAATLLLADGGIDAVSMDAVASRARVSRPLVYKHFANRHDLLAEVYRREAAQLDAAIVAAVREAVGFEGKLRALVDAVLDAETTHAPIFAPLVRAGARDADVRRERRARDERTVRHFARLAVSELGVGETEATAATATLLSGLESIQAQWRAAPTAERRTFLVELYVDLVVGALARLAEHTGPDEP